jgi:integrase
LLLGVEGIVLGDEPRLQWNHRDDQRRSDIDLWQREITVHGKGGRPRIVKISHEAARGRGPLPAGPRPPPAGLAASAVVGGGRGPLTASGIYQAVTRRGRQCGVSVWPHRFRHLLSA